MAWHLLLDPAGRPGAENMAIDSTLLDEADRDGMAFLRLYRWNPPCLSFGRNEPALRRYDRARIDALGIDVVRRPTGGRAVWHEHELTYAVAAPVSTFGTLRASYQAIHERLAAALRALGARAALAPDGHTPGLAAGACFATPAGGEVMVSGRKLVGSAQVRRGRAFLQHGSILLAGSQAVVNDVSREQGAASSETSLTAELGRPVSFGDVATAIIECWGADLAPSATVRESSGAPVHPYPPLATPFSDPAWTWRR